MKKVIFIALDFPDIKKTTHLYSDLMHEFLKNGHDVFVIAPVSDKKDSEIVIESGIKVLRVPTLKLFGKSKIVKGLSNLLLPFQYKKALKKHKVTLDFDLILMPTPPITLIDVGLWIKKKSKGKLYLILRDIFPQNAVDLKMMKPNGLIHSYFRKKEIQLYQGSDSIGCMSPANVEYVKQHNPNMDFNKLHLLPNWENLHEVQEIEDEQSIREEYGLRDKIVAIFGGNIGLPQKIENIISLANICQELDDLVFFIVGRGTEKKKIAAMVESLNLKNVVLRDGLLRSDYNKILRLADIGLISLSEDFTIPNFPSKVTAYYCLKKPVLASVDINTDFGIIQEKIKCGFWSEAGDTEAFKENLLKLYNSKQLRQELGQNGYNYMVNNLLPSHAYNIICAHI
ncbi:glycosyltransferase family 4 protein [Bacteroidota bacterium]